MGRLNLLPNHLWGLLVIGIFYTSLTPTYARDTNDIADLSLDSLLDNIVVAASKHEETLEESPANVFIVSRAMIDNYGCQTIGEALALVPGIYVTDDYSLAQIGVRGISTFGDWNSHVMILIDGRPTSEQYGGTSNLDVSGLSLDNIERIEVIKGPASSLYGSNAFFGLINLISRTQEDNEIRVSGDYFHGTDTKSSSLGFFHHFDGDWALSMTGSMTNRGGNDLFFSEFSDLGDSTLLQLDDDGYNQFYLDSSDFTGGWARDKNTQENLSTHNRLTWRNFGLTAHYAQLKTGVAHSMWGSLFQRKENQYYESRMYVDFDYSSHLSEQAEIWARLSYGRYDFDDYILYNYGSLTASPAYLPGPIWKDMEYDRYVGAEFRLNFDFNTNHRLSIGGDGQHHRIGHSSGETEADGETIIENVIIEENRNNQGEIYNLYLQDEYRLSSYAKVVGGLHFNYYTYTSGKVVPKGALVLTPYSSGTYKLVASRGYRSPTFYELIYDDGLLYYRNPNLKPELITSYELIASHHFPYGLTVDVAGNTSRITDMIQETAIDADDPEFPGGTYDEGVFQFRNRGEFRSNTIEGSIRSNPLYRWSGFANVTWQEIEARDDASSQTINSPRWLSNLALNYQIIEDHLSASAKTQYVSSRLLWDGSRMEGYWLTDLTIRSQNLVNGLELGLAVKNLFDQTYRTPLSFEYAPSTTIGHTGRSIYLTAQLARGW